MRPGTQRPRRPASSGQQAKHSFIVFEAKNPALAEFLAALPNGIKSAAIVGLLERGLSARDGVGDSGSPASPLRWAELGVLLASSSGRTRRPRAAVSPSPPSPQLAARAEPPQEAPVAPEPTQPQQQHLSAPPPPEPPSPPAPTPSATASPALGLLNSFVRKG